MRIPLILLLAGSLGCAASGSTGPAAGSSTSTPAASTLPSAPPRENAAPLVEKGLTAVREGQYGIAGRYFTEARRFDPYRPEILFNLGLAAAKDGNELVAIPWFEAYLAAAPGAANAAAVRAEIDRLETAAWDKVTKIMAKAKAAAGEKQGPLQSVAYYRACLGDIEGAVDLAKVSYDKADPVEWRSRYWKNHAETLQYSDDLPRAVAAGLKCTRAEDVKDVLASAVDRLGWEPKIPEINAVIERAPAEVRDELRARARPYVCREYIKRQETLAVDELLSKMTESQRDDQYGNMTIGLMDTDRAAARKYIDKVQGRDTKLSLLVDLAIETARARETAAAAAIAREALPLLAASDRYNKEELQAKTAALLGNLDVAVALAGKMSYNLGLITSDSGRFSMFGLIIELRVLAGDRSGAEALVGKVNALQLTGNDEYYKRWHGGRPEYGMARGLIEKGELAAAWDWYLKTRTVQKRELLDLYVSAWLKAGDAARAEQTVWAIPMSAYQDENLAPDLEMGRSRLAQTQVEALLKIAATRPPEDAKRLLKGASDLLRATGQFDYLIGSLASVAEQQEKIGDAAGAAETRSVTPSKSVEKWTVEAYYVRSSDVARVEEALREQMKDKKPDEVPGVLAGMAVQMGKSLFRFRAAREKP